jgi:hypothetical protein
MNPILRNVLAVVAGVIVGGFINMGIIILFGNIIPAPEGVNVMDPESIKANMNLFEAKHFIGPFLAHAVGTLIGAYTAARFAATHQMKLALLVGVFFLLGGIMNVMSMPAPMWFNILDLVAAYIPMGWLGGKMIQRS